MEHVPCLNAKSSSLWRSEGVNMSELCLRSSSPEASPSLPGTGAEMEQLVVDLRREHPTKGGSTGRMLKDSGHNGVPSKSTVTASLGGLIEPAYAQAQRRNAYLWQMD